MGLFPYKPINGPSGSFSRVTTTLDATCRYERASLAEGQDWRTRQVDFLEIFSICHVNLMQKK